MLGVLLPGYPARGPESEIRVTLVYNLATKRSIKIIYSNFSDLETFDVSVQTCFSKFQGLIAQVVNISDEWLSGPL